MLRLGAQAFPIDLDGSAPISEDSGEDYTRRTMREPPGTLLRIGTHVQQALAEHRGVVALETTLIAHGLPSPENIAVARELEDVIGANGSVPATVGVIEGVPTVGLSDEEIERIATQGQKVAKLSSRDLGTAVQRRIDGATTVAGTITLATKAGVEVMATGGLGGVHLGARESYDESADLLALHEVPILVVCSGVKSILDVSATLERLETLEVPVVGFKTDRFPGFYVSTTEEALDWSVDSIDSVVTAFVAHLALGRGGMLLANPVPERDQLDVATHDAVLADALKEAEFRHVRAKAVTPFLLARLASETSGESVRVNRTLVRNNAELAGKIARELAEARADG